MGGAIVVAEAALCAYEFLILVEGVVVKVEAAIVIVNVNASGYSQANA